MTILLHKSTTQTLKFYVLLTPFVEILFEETAGEMQQDKPFLLKVIWSLYLEGTLIRENKMIQNEIIFN